MPLLMPVGKADHLWMRGVMHGDAVCTLDRMQSEYLNVVTSAWRKSGVPSMAKLFFHYSSMNAGKTTQLLQVAHNYEERGLRTLLFKPDFDDRDGADVIASRIGIAKPCELFNSKDNLFQIIEAHNDKQKLDCILIDEAQFLTPEQVWQLSDVVDTLNVPVMTYGLRVDFQSKFFPGSAELMAIADVLRDIRTIDETGKNATMVVRLDENGDVLKDGPQTVIGGNETYRAVTRREWKRLMGL